MNNLKELLAKASRKCEMRWKVLVFDPNKDNELIDEFKDFECIDCATAKKRELLEKHPDKTIEIVSESISRKTEERVFSKVVGVKDMDSAIKILKERIGIDYFGFKQSKEKTDGNAVFAFSKKYNIPHKVARFNPNKMTMDILVESAQKNESYTIQNVKTRTDAEKIIKDKCKPKDFRFTDIGIAYDGKKSIAQYMPNSNQLVIFESVTKANYNEIVKVLSDTIAKAAKKYPEAKLVKSYQATTGSHGVFLDEGLHFIGKDALSKALAVSKELQKAMSKYGFKNDIGGRLPYMIGNNYYSTIVTFGSISQGSNGASVGYTYMKDALKFLESAQMNEKHLFKKGDRVIAYGNKGTIDSVEYVDPAQTTKLFKVLMDGTKKIEKFREPELRFIESSQKNEALYKIAKTNKEKEEILAKIEKDPSLKLVSIDAVVSGWKNNKNGIPIAQYNTRITYKKESAQKNEDFKKPKTYEELKAGEWYEVEGKLFQIADRQPIDNEVQAFRVQPDYSVGNGVHVLYKSFYKPEKFKFVDKRDTLTKIIKEKEAQIAKLRQEIDALKRSL